MRGLKPPAWSRDLVMWLVRLRIPRAVSLRCSRRPLNILCASSCRKLCVGCGGAVLDVGAGAGGHVHVGDDGHVEGAVEASVSAGVDAVPDGVPGGRGDRVDAGEAGGSGLGSDVPRGVTMWSARLRR